MEEGAERSSARPAPFAPRTDRATRKHVARFMVVARYMGSRASVICEASIETKRPDDRAWIDLRTGMLYGLPKGYGFISLDSNLCRLDNRGHGPRALGRWLTLPFVRDAKRRWRFRGLVGRTQDLSERGGQLRRPYRFGFERALISSSMNRSARSIAVARSNTIPIL